MRSGPLDTNWLEDFLTVLEQGNFSRAAEHRAVTQPALSRRIRALEEWVGTPLFDCSTLALRATGAGERFRPTAAEMLPTRCRSRSACSARKHANQRSLKTFGSLLSDNSAAG
jgi:DNA-binding transcriptional LysR family regulator